MTTADEDEKWIVAADKAHDIITSVLDNELKVAIDKALAIMKNEGGYEAYDARGEIGGWLRRHADEID